MSVYKNACKEIGITEGTEEFGACVMDLYKNKDKVSIASKKNDKMAPYKSTCSDIGFKEGTEKFGECVLQLYARDKDKKKQMITERQRRLEEAKRNSKEREAMAIERERLGLEQQRIDLQRRQAQSKALKDFSDKLLQQGEYAPKSSQTNCFLNGNILNCSTW